MVEHIWRTYHKQLHSFILKRVSDKEAANDILQDVFVKIQSKIEDLKEGSKLKAWLYQITRNSIIDYHRKLNRVEELALNDFESESEKKDLADIETCILPMIKSLPENYREALLLSELHGLSQKELSEKLQISYSAAKSRVQRGRSLLKLALSQCCSFEHDSKGRVVGYEKKVSSCENCKK